MADAVYQLFYAGHSDVYADSDVWHAYYALLLQDFWFYSVL
ncbi:type IV secretion system VirB6 family domain protein [Anaplasma phagocytophilum str. ApNP]|uniref:Type IV secretion system VirB6 family domain protein n=1 Tax=Anaplasma phagocytophilum str. ApNP TaxID=1359153 RepID=A0A0F3NEM8_ANAPH|nr:type IV secretion system VirB6 family domain protein [Anaplasma phagocytophilum str. ApNP]